MADKRRSLWLLLFLVPLLFAAALIFLLARRPYRPETTALKPGPTGKVNILIIGKDARAIAQAPDQGSGRLPREERSHSDVVVIAHVNLDRGRVNLVSLPRDLLVQVPGVTAAESATDFRQMEKLTHAHIIGGQSLLRRTVEQLLGVTIDRFIAFDFDSFRMAFSVLRPFLLNLKVADTRITDPNQALRFVRRRYGLPADDLDRCRNNLLFLRTTISRTWWLCNTRLAEILLARVLDIVGPDTDLTAAELLQLCAGLRYAGFNPDRIQTAVLVGEGTTVTLERYGLALSCYLPAYAEIRRQVDHFLLDQDSVPALDFMTNQPYRAPDYLFADYAFVPADTTADSAAVLTLLKEMEMLGIEPQPDSVP